MSSAWLKSETLLSLSFSSTLTRIRHHSAQLSRSTWLNRNLAASTISTSTKKPTLLLGPDATDADREAIRWRVSLCRLRRGKGEGVQRRPRRPEEALGDALRHFAEDLNRREFSRDRNGSPENSNSSAQCTSGSSAANR